MARSMRLPLSTKPAISKYNLCDGAMSRSPTRCVRHLDNTKDFGCPPENVETAARNTSPRLPSQPRTVSAIFRSEQFISPVKTTGTLKLIFRSEQFTLQADATSHESQSSSQLIEKSSRFSRRQDSKFTTQLSSDNSDDGILQQKIHRCSSIASATLSEQSRCTEAYPAEEAKSCFTGFGFG